MQTNTPMTTRHAFGLTNIEGVNLFDVRDGVPIADALNTASAYLSTALGVVENAPDEGGLAAHNLVEMAKALVDSVIGSIEFGGRGPREAVAAD